MQVHCEVRFGNTRPIQDGVKTASAWCTMRDGADDNCNIHIMAASGTRADETKDEAKGAVVSGFVGYLSNLR